MEKDVFDYMEEEESSPSLGVVWNILTIVVLVMALCVGILFLTVFINPSVGINPFPPPTMPVLIALDTSTPTPRQVLPPTWTPTAPPSPTRPTPLSLRLLHPHLKSQSRLPIPLRRRKAICPLCCMRATPSIFPTFIMPIWAAIGWAWGGKYSA